ncbi:unnamed protein product [Mycena citricolor]|uniref:Adipose-regulatory protein n=1 Tax=Mycena citricolor TaxID=2018698 RepID=A0AAD2HT13_9AGAR|nr:unnamed protein product [Mycena citricolor]CAK5280475.1 unnamed protein product [Mycena citricolor]
MTLMAVDAPPPRRSILATAAVSIASFLRPRLPHILPFFIYLSLFPLLAFFSATAGFLVWENAAVAWRVPLYLQYGDGLPPYADVQLPSLVAKQRYDFYLDLQVPAVESNYALGNFMVNFSLLTRGNHTLVSVRKPAIVVSPQPRLFRRTSSEISIRVPVLSSYAAGTSKLAVHIEVGRRDNWKTLGTGQGRELSVTSASLHGTVVHHGIRGLVTRFPLLSALAASALFFFVSSSIVAGCILPLVFDHNASAFSPLPQDLAAHPSLAPTSDDEWTSESEKPLARGRGSQTSIKTEEDYPTQVTDMPVASGSTTTTTLRRRQSRIYEYSASDSDSSS